MGKGLLDALHRLADLGATQPAALGSILALVYAVVTMCLNAFVYRTAVFDPAVIVALIGALYAAGVVRPLVTPLTRPRDKAGRPLVPVLTSKRAAVPPDPAAHP